MKIIADKHKLSEGKYDQNGFAICKCGKHRYPSKKMLVDFLKPLKLPGTADIWSMSQLNTGEVTIFLELKYKTRLK